MQVNIGRMKKWDWGVVIAFVVTIVGVSIPWWKTKLGDVFGGLYEGLGGLAGVPDVDANAFGWDLGAGRAAFVFALFVTIWVFAKILLPADKPLPKWYMEAWPVLIIGGVLTLIGIIGTADAPAGGYDFWGWRPGGLITLAGRRRRGLLRLDDAQRQERRVWSVTRPERQRDKGCCAASGRERRLLRRPAASSALVVAARSIRARPSARTAESLSDHDPTSTRCVA